MLPETLKKIVDETPGALGAILMGFDGIAVMQHLADDAQLEDIESTAMEFSFRFIELRKAAESLEMGEIADITIRAAERTLLCRVLNEEFFVALLLADAGHFGKGRWLLRSTAPALTAEL
ncbi:MAG: roadblock/LC7 domain-containing protein [Myxococcota bacterium]